jgi:hypothetical protein
MLETNLMGSFQRIDPAANSLDSQMSQRLAEFTGSRNSFIYSADG